MMARDRDGGRVVGIILIEASHDLDIVNHGARVAVATHGASMVQVLHIDDYRLLLMIIGAYCNVDDPTLILHTLKRREDDRTWQVMQTCKPWGNWCKSLDIYQSFLKMASCCWMSGVARGDPFDRP